ncbi:MAG: mercury resistance system periplasmic binding protein MerP [Burkholderiales bacterium]|nr:mercury resistance system periplasmic binding protein MerP [Burkholderiales bacterium]
MRNIIASIALTLASSTALAAVQTVTLSVPGMDCPVCPITVKKALEKVAGVKKVNVEFEAREAKVTFDDAISTTDKLIKATSDAGYPATLKGVAK